MIDKRINYRFGSEGYQGGATNQGGAGKGTGVSTGGARGQAMGMGGKQKGGTFSETGGKTTGGSGGPDRSAVSQFSQYGKNVMAQNLNPNLRFDPRDQTMKSRFNPGLIFGGLLSLITGIPGVGLALGGLRQGFNFIGDKLQDLRGYNEDGSPRTQAEYELAMQQKSLQNRLDNLYSRKDRGLTFSQKNIDMLEAMGIEPTTARNVLTGRDLKGFTPSRTGITSVSPDLTEAYDEYMMDAPPENFLSFEQFSNIYGSR